MKSPISLTARISMLFAGSAACVLLVAGLLFMRAVENQFKRDDMGELDGKISLIRNVLQNTDKRDIAAVLSLSLRDAVAGHPGIAITVTGKDGTMLFSVGPENVVSRLAKEAATGKPLPAIWTPDNYAYRVTTDRFAPGNPAGEPANVAVALNITHDRAFITEFRKFMWFGMAITALVTGWLGWVAVRKGLSPLNEVSAIMTGVSAQRLNKSMVAADAPAELQVLVSAFNSMLARLDDSFRRLSEFSLDIAHELRTPINNLLMHTEVTLTKERDAPEYRANLQSNMEEFNRLGRMISNMLFIAKAENSLVVLQRETIHLHEEVAKLIDFYEALASEGHIRLVQSGKATVCADRLMIQRALSNLLSNAISYTSEGMAVEVIMNENADQATVAVVNPGPEIPAEHLPRIFERLYRVDAPHRKRNAENMGLGLAITKSIVEMHGGAISAGSLNGRTCFTITLPQRRAA